MSSQPDPNTTTAGPGAPRVRETPAQPLGAIPRHASAPPAASDSGGSVGNAIGGLARILLFPLIFVFRPLIFRISERQGTQIATFTSFSGLIYCWPIMLMGFIGALATHWGASPIVIGWIYVWVILLTLIVLGTDISRNSILVWALVVGLVLAVGALVNAKFQIPVLHWIYSHFAAHGVQFNYGIGMSLSELLLIVFVVIGFQALLDGRHEISSREVTHRRFLRASESWPLNINRVRMDWPDLMEMFVLFGAGHLVIIDQDRREVLRIPNIPFLWFFRDEVNRILDIMATTEVDASRVMQGTGSGPA